eukprot:12250203-Heterocapsa_arctica.AAC.1
MEQDQRKSTVASRPQHMRWAGCRQQRNAPHRTPARWTVGRPGALADRRGARRAADVRDAVDRSGR